MIYYAITSKRDKVTRYVKEGDYMTAYEIIMEITGDNHEDSEDASSWCELACVGETYEHDKFTIEIIED